MKKTLIKSILLFLALGTLSACVLYNGKNKDGTPKGGTSSEGESSEPSSGTSSEDGGGVLPPAPTGSVNLYLVLGPNGTYEGNPGDKITAKYLENTKAITMNIGDALPKGDKVKSNITGSTFSHWIDRATTETVTVAPAEESVLVAVFTGGDGSNAYSPTGMPTEGYGFMFYDKTAEGKDYYKIGTEAGKVTYDDIEYTQYKIADFQLVAGQKFQLYDFSSESGWKVTMDTASCNNNYSTYIDDINYGDWYYVKQTFDAKDIYIKLAFNNDKLYIGKEREAGDLPGSGFGFLFEKVGTAPQEYKEGTNVGKDTFDGITYDQYKIDDFQMVSGKRFKLCNFEVGAEWVVPLDSHSCGSNPDSYIKVVDGWYVIQQTFTTNGIYIKLAYEHDNLYIGI